MSNDDVPSFREYLSDFSKKFESVNQTVITKKQFDEIFNHISTLENGLPVKVFAKATMFLLKKENTGIAVTIPNEGQFMVAFEDGEVTITRTKMDCPDGARFTLLPPLWTPMDNLLRINLMKKERCPD